MSKNKSQNLKIDKFGRIIIPKKIRKKFDLNTNVEFAVSESPAGFLITPAKEIADIKEEDGLLIVKGPIDMKNIDNILKNQREEKINKILKDFEK